MEGWAGGLGDSGLASHVDDGGGGVVTRCLAGVFALNATIQFKVGGARAPICLPSAPLTLIRFLSASRLPTVTPCMAG